MDPLVGAAVREDDKPGGQERDSGVAASTHDLLQGLLVNWSVREQLARLVAAHLLQHHLLVGGSVSSLR
jgi:hypothetical protein